MSIGELVRPQDVYSRPAERTECHERRRFERVLCPPLHVSGLRATARDVSRGGIALTVEHPLPRGLRVRLTLRDAISRTTCELYAEVVACRGTRAGLRWLEVTPEQDLWLSQRVHIWLLALEGASRR
jgi:hypothetical protein